MIMIQHHQSHHNIDKDVERLVNLGKKQIVRFDLMSVRNSIWQKSVRTREVSGKRRKKSGRKIFETKAESIVRELRRLFRIVML